MWQISICFQKHRMKYKKYQILKTGDVRHFQFKEETKYSLIIDIIFVLHTWQITICFQKHRMKYKNDQILKGGDVRRFQF